MLGTMPSILEFCCLPLPESGLGTWSARYFVMFPLLKRLLLCPAVAMFHLDCCTPLHVALVVVPGSLSLCPNQELSDELIRAHAMSMLASCWGWRRESAGNIESAQSACPRRKGRFATV